MASGTYPAKINPSTPFPPPPPPSTLRQTTTYNELTYYDVEYVSGSKTLHFMAKYISLLSFLLRQFLTVASLPRRRF